MTDETAVLRAALDQVEAERAEWQSLTGRLLALVEDEYLRRVLAEAASELVVELGAPGLEFMPERRVAPAPTDEGDAMSMTYPLGGRLPDPPRYRSAGEFVVDYVRARGLGRDDGYDRAALERVAAAYEARASAEQTTGHTPGLLPEPIVGEVAGRIEAARPFITSLGGPRPLRDIPGRKFSRPRIVRHTKVGRQEQQKTPLPTRAMQIIGVEFEKRTYGGAVDVSRQDIDWTSPAAWNALLSDLGDEYSTATEVAAVAAFHASLTAVPVAVNGDGVAAWLRAFYAASARSLKVSGRLPDRVWVSLDVWAALGSLVEFERTVLVPVPGAQPGTSSLAAMAGTILGLTRIVVPDLPPGTCIVGRSDLYEVYEEVIGLLTAIEPGILGVEVAYGGYVAWGSLIPESFIPITPPDDLPEIGDVGGEDDGGEELEP